MPSPEIVQRRDMLMCEVAAARDRALRLGRYNYWASLLLMGGALISSGLAAVGGIFLDWSPKSTGLVASLPGVFAIIATSFRFEGKANWQERKAVLMHSLFSRLRYQLPEDFNADNIAAVAKQRDERLEAMQAVWEKENSLSWKGFKKD
jgi:hypothetical protein